MVIENHWVCTATRINGMNNTYEIFNSKPFMVGTTTKAKEITNTMINQIYQKDMKLTTVINKMGGQQIDNYSCGYFVMLFIQRIIEGKTE